MGRGRGRLRSKTVRMQAKALQRSNSSGWLPLRLVRKPDSRSIQTARPGASTALAISFSSSAKFSTVRWPP